MAHFAEIDSDGLVLRIVFVANENIVDESGQENEELGVSFCNEHANNGIWIQTSINTKNGVHIDPATGLPSGQTGFRGNFAEVGGYFLEDFNRFIPKQPADWFYLNEKFEWVCPISLNPETGIPLDEESLRLFRFRDLYRLEPVIPADPTDPFIEACNTNNYMIRNIEEITHGYNRTLEAFRQDDGSIDFSWLGPCGNVIDLAPYAFIGYYSGREPGPQIEQTARFFYEIHPFSVGLSLHELFRLIIEWAWAFTECDNQEPMAELCHNILRIVQMPIEVRTELLDLPAQQVEKYLKNSTFISTPEIDEPNEPLLFRKWITELKRKFPARKLGDPLHPLTMLDSYPT